MSTPHPDHTEASGTPPPDGPGLRITIRDRAGEIVQDETLPGPAVSITVGVRPSPHPATYTIEAQLIPARPVDGTLITPEIAAHVLWQLSAPGGYPPGSFVRGLLDFLVGADAENRRILTRAYPAYATALYLAQHQTGGADMLREIIADGSPRYAGPDDEPGEPANIPVRRQGEEGRWETVMITRSEWDRTGGRRIDPPDRPTLEDLGCPCEHPDCPEQPEEIRIARERATNPDIIPAEPVHVLDRGKWPFVHAGLCPARRTVGAPCACGKL